MLFSTTAVLALLVARPGNLGNTISKLDQITYVNTFSFHSYVFQLMISVLIKSSCVHHLDHVLPHFLFQSQQSPLKEHAFQKNLKGQYLLTPSSRVLLEKLMDFQLVKKFPTFYGTQRFITAVTSACHLSLS